MLLVNIQVKYSAQAVNAYCEITSNDILERAKRIGENPKLSAEKMRIDLLLGAI